MGFFDQWQLAVSVMEMFDAVEAHGDGRLT